jgi:murein DD-endopeptidase MepM/ murein hydrolase activator NlpD
VDHETAHGISWFKPFHEMGSLVDVAKVIGKRGEQPKPCKAANRLPVLIQRNGDPSKTTRVTEHGRVPVQFASYEVPAAAGKASCHGMIWPLCGKVSRPFSDECNHRGIDICAPEGTPVLATRDGKVLYSGNELAGYGNIVIIEHATGLASVYAHNHCNLVRPGQRVRRGQVIAQVGQTGNATTPHCHFEIRRSAKAVDPRPMLP